MGALWSGGMATLRGIIATGLAWSLLITVVKPSTVRAAELMLQELGGLGNVASRSRELRASTGEAYHAILPLISMPRHERDLECLGDLMYEEDLIGERIEALSSMVFMEPSIKEAGRDRADRILEEYIGNQIAKAPQERKEAASLALMCMTTPFMNTETTKFLPLLDDTKTAMEAIKAKLASP